MQWLKQGTATTIKIGPFLDDSDGKTAETALTISQADVRLSKNGGAFAQKSEATSCTHDENGWYGCPLDATDTGTLGRLKLTVAESGALPVWQEFMVVPANVYDSLMGGSDYLQTDARQIEGVDATNQINTECDTAISDALNNIADAVLERGASNTEDTADTTSLTALILARLESSVSGTTWTIRKTDGTTFVVKTVTVDATADPITGVT